MPFHWFWFDVWCEQWGGHNLRICRKPHQSHLAVHIVLCQEVHGRRGRRRTCPGPGGSSTHYPCQHQLDRFPDKLFGTFWFGNLDYQGWCASSWPAGLPSCSLGGSWTPGLEHIWGNITIAKKYFFVQLNWNLGWDLTFHRNSLPWQRTDCQQVQETAGRTAAEGCTSPKIEVFSDSFF